MGDKIQLTAKSENPFVQVFLIDSDLKLLDKAIGTLQGEYEAGIYKIKFKAGNNIREELISLEPGEKYKHVEAPEMLYYSSIPIPGITKNSSEIDFAKMASSAYDDLQKSPVLFVFLRSNDEKFDFVSQLKLLSIVDDEEYAVRFSNRVSNNNNKILFSEMESAAAILLPLKSGCYVLHYKNKKKNVEFEQTLILRSGWQTQLFITCENGELDLFNASLSMSQGGFYPSEELKKCELARIALSNNAPVISDKETKMMLYAKFENPMLGIYGAHLILLKEDIHDKKNLLVTVFDNLCDLLGKHPDVMVIGLWLKENYPDIKFRNSKILDDYRFESPPLLLTSWRILLILSSKNYSLIPKDSITEKIAGNTFSQGPWLIWKAEEKRKVTDTISFKKEMSTSNTLGFMTTEDFMLDATYEDPERDGFEMLSEKLPEVFSFLLSNRDYNVMIKKTNFTSQELCVLKYLDHLLPVDYLSELHKLSENKLNAMEENYVRSMLKYITGDVIDLFRKAMLYCDEQNGTKLNDVLNWLDENKPVNENEREGDLFDIGKMAASLCLPLPTIERAIKGMLTKIGNNSRDVLMPN